MKSLLPLILALLLALTLAGCAGDDGLDPIETQILPQEEAVSKTTLGDFEITHYSTYASISAYKGENPSPVLPTESGDLPIRYVGDSAFEGNDKITSVTIGGNILIVGRMAFRNCTSLTSVTISEGVEQIGAYAFSGTGLTKLDLPESVWGIGREAFLGVAIEQLYLPSSVFFLDDYAFHACKNLKTVTLSPRLTELSARVFEGCTALESIIIPSSVIEIGDYALANCPSLQTLTLGDQIETLGTGVLAGNTTTVRTRKEGVVTKWCAANAVTCQVLTKEQWQAYEDEIAAKENAA